MERIEIVENGLFLVFEIADDKCFKFLHFGKKPFNEKRYYCAIYIIWF